MTNPSRRLTETAMICLLPIHMNIFITTFVFAVKTIAELQNTIFTKYVRYIFPIYSLFFCCILKYFIFSNIQNYYNFHETTFFLKHNTFVVDMYCELIQLFDVLHFVCVCINDQNVHVTLYHRCFKVCNHPCICHVMSLKNISNNVISNLVCSIQAQKFIQ